LRAGCPHGQRWRLAGAPAMTASERDFAVCSRCGRSRYRREFVADKLADPAALCEQSEASFHDTTSHQDRADPPHAAPPKTADPNLDKAVQILRAAGDGGLTANERHARAHIYLDTLDAGVAAGVLRTDGHRYTIAG
jgi:hypothetical protein